VAEEDQVFPTGLSVDEARSRIVEIAARHPLPAERVALESAHGRILGSDVIAPRNVPGFANSAMDGFAVRAADLSAHGGTLRLIGEIFAGGREAPAVLAETCVRITTGAPLPRGADTVVMKENTRVEGDRVHITSGVPIGSNVRPESEDFRAGDRALQRGVRLTPARLGALASFGFEQIDVLRQPRAVLLTTGDELVAPGRALGFGQIYDSNRHSLGAILEQHGVNLLRHERLRDDPVRLREALQRAGNEADLVISSGGVSAGEADYLPRLVAEIGKVYFWKVRIKPGMPFLCGRVGNALLCALPGNPVSGIATFLALVKPAVDAMTGAQPAPAPLRARLRHAIGKRHARTEFQRARLECDERGTLWASTLAQQGSGMMRGVAEADALILLGEGERDFCAGDIVDVLVLADWPRF